MSATLPRLVRGAKRRCADWTRHRLEEATHCRQCDNLVQPLSEVCPHCGAGSPARMSRSAGVAVVGLTVLVLVVYGVARLAA